jgi:hypothetical protein
MERVQNPALFVQHLFEIRSGVLNQPPAAILVIRLFSNTYVFVQPLVSAYENLYFSI